LYKAPLTATVVASFLSTYQSLDHQNFPRQSSEPFVYVDSQGIKLVTKMVGETIAKDDGIFALSMAEDGWMEMLALHD
jgi:hypothetical protein